MNKLIQKGNLTRDVELKYLPDGTPVATFGIATNRVWFDSKKEKHEEVTFTDWRAWGKTAETIAGYFHKGRPILLEGHLSQDEWEDKQTGQKRRKTVAIVQHWEFAGEAREGQGGKASPAPVRPNDAPSPDGAVTAEDDDIPF